MTSPGNNNTSHTAISNASLFGVPLTNLCQSEGGVKIPGKIEQLITKIEILGLYAEGLYRKSGVNSKIKELKTKMSEMALTGELDYESYNVHVLANVLKSFLRDMPEPLLSFDRYDDFLRASELVETEDRVSTLLSLIKKLPIAHHFLLERLVFHLALVAQREQFNRMSASSLAIVFAPCVLRTNRQIPAQDSLNDIGRQTKCIETLITQKMITVKSTLADIYILDKAEHTATSRLSTLRGSKVFTPEELAPRPTNMESESEEALLEDHIQEIKKEKEMLTSTLPSLARASSDDDLLSTDMDGEGGSLDDLSSGGGGGGGGGSSRGERDCLYTSDSRDMKDSIDSSIGSFGDSISRSGGDLTMTSSSNRDSSEPVTVSYNLREQNIDYMHHQQPTTPPQRNVGAFIRNSYLVPKTSGGTAMTSSSAWWSGSQQHLSYSMQGCSTTTTTTGTTGGSELQRQKPIAVRSMSGGYEPTSTTTILQSSSQVALSPEGSIDKSSKSSKDSRNNNNNNNRNTKRQSSLDDEPIMV